MRGFLIYIILNMHYSKIKNLDIANGDGIRVSLFVSGCRHHCKGCFNSETWDFNHGELYTEDTQSMILQLMDSETIHGLSILGGEPLDVLNQETISSLILEVRKSFPEKNIWLWTGYTYGKDIPKTEYTDIIMKNIDVLIDGEFKEDLKIPNLKYRGSSNQRIILLNPDFKLVL